MFARLSRVSHTMCVVPLAAIQLRFLFRSVLHVCHRWPDHQCSWTESVKQATMEQTEMDWVPSSSESKKDLSFSEVSVAS